MNHNERTRARTSSSRRLCNTVMSAVVVEKYDVPKIKPVTNTSGVFGAEAKRTSATAK